jgi:chemotaxis protein methyltransferase CheR
MAFTFFFRDRHTLEQLAKLLLPNIQGASNVRIWDAGCAMGPEPYTFAIILCEAMGRDKFSKVKILASDIDETSNFREIVNAGIYPKSELSRMPEDIFEQYFQDTDKKSFHQIHDLIRDSVEFVQHDLLTYKPISNSYHAVICKNVLLHFQYPERIEVIKMFHRVLDNGGFLTMEQTQQMPEECLNLFEKALPDANIYRKI